MNTLDLKEYLAQRPYPGRGILLGSGHNGTWAQSVMAYFISFTCTGSPWKEGWGSP